ncbi:putative exocyst complex component 1-like isoform 2 [Scophthalmus maximus]|nr:putative exocyst complex component 1-like isoform 2 [Scophthalmus maximus]
MFSAPRCPRRPPLAALANPEHRGHGRYKRKEEKGRKEGEAPRVVLDQLDYMHVNTVSPHRAVTLRLTSEGDKKTKKTSVEILPSVPRTPRRVERLYASARGELLGRSDGNTSVGGGQASKSSDGGNIFRGRLMSSLLREEMQRVLFRPAKQRLVEFIEIEEPTQGRHFLCVAVAKNKVVQDSYRRTEMWSLQDLTLVDGRDPDVDDPCFLLHFDKVRTVTAISCSAKYAFVRALVALSDQHCQRSLNLRNFDWTYIKPTSFYSNRGDCVVLTQICFYAFNLVCLSMCPVPLDA